MATQKQSRPGRALAVLAILLVVIYAWAFWPFASGRSHTPRLGLDLQGGTSITLQPQAEPGKQIQNTDIDQAVTIIRNRVNGLGVSEAQVTTEGSGTSRAIVVSIPGATASDLLAAIGQTAVLNFRPVLAEDSGVSTPTTSASASASPRATASAKATAASSPSASASGNGRPLSAAIAPAAASSPSPSATPSATPAASPSPISSAGANVSQPLQSKTEAGLVPLYNNLNCATHGTNVAQDDPAQYLATCSRDGLTKYALAPTAVYGKNIKGATAGTISTTGEWVVNLTFDSKGTKDFATTTSKLVSQTAPTNQFAIVLDGLVVSSPTVQSAITDGNAQISGSFTSSTATDLANALKYGALPLTFTKADVQTVSPTLGSDQLRAGLIAGALGLALVVLYLLIYYRALALVAVGSLGIAAAITYGMIVGLGNAVHFTLSLAGVTGLIVSIGITADSFIVFFERLRDEVRDGRTLRVGVETGWVRARRTIIAADSVSLLAAAVLYWLSVSSVRGFAFTLGLTTLVDLVVVFLFTKPVVTLLARTKFFGQGHRFSGLDAGRFSKQKPPAPEPAPAARQPELKEA